MNKETSKLMFSHCVDLEYDDEEQILVKIHKCGYYKNIVKIIEYLKEEYGLKSAYMYCIESEDDDCSMKILLSNELEDEE